MSHRDRSDDASFYDPELNELPGEIADIEEQDEIPEFTIEETDCLLEAARKAAVFTARKVAEMRAEAEEVAS